MKKFSKWIINPQAATLAVLVLSLAIGTDGFCDTASSNSIEAPDVALNKITDKVRGVLFSSAIRKAALTIGFGAGLLRAFMTGSVRPLMIYGGLGLAVCYLPAMVDWMSNI